MCIHFWLISTPAPREHITGICKYCKKKRDFTILQEQDRGFRQICLTNTLTRPDVDMTRIMADRTNNGKRKKGRPVKLSRGRVK